MKAEYRIDPDFVRPEPTPANHFSWLETGDPGTRHDRIREAADKMRTEGATQFRVTITGPEAEDDQTGYPPGLWIEGWNDPQATLLPFGTAAEEGGAIYPPLTCAES